MCTQSISFYSIDIINLNYSNQVHCSRKGKLSNFLLEDETATRPERPALALPQF